MIQFSFQLSDYRTLLKSLARKLNLSVTKKKLVIPPHIGSGYAYASNINQDISYGIMNFSLKEDLIFSRKKSSQGLVLAFNQIDINDFVRFAEDGTSIVDKSARLNHIYLSSANANLEITISNNSPTKIVVVFFSPELVRKCIKKDILVDLMVYTENGIQNMYREPITFGYRQLLDDIFDTELDSPLSNLLLQNRILTLTEKFLAGFLEKDTAGDSNKNVLVKEKDIEALREVEEMLRTKDLNKFPSIDVLSMSARMSSTNLKTKFKRVYGMKLYEYYNRNRLEKAREMLQTGKYSVKAAGLEIGFSNLSNFAKAFKREFGILPNEMLRIK